MQSKVLSTFLCSAVVASCVFADITQGSAPKNAPLTELSKVSAATNAPLSELSSGGELNSRPLSELSKASAATNAPFAELAKSGATTSLPFTELSNGGELNSRAFTELSKVGESNSPQNAEGALSEFAPSEFTLLAQNTATQGVQTQNAPQSLKSQGVQSGAKTQAAQGKASQILLAQNDSNQNARSIGATRHDPRFTQDFPQDIPQTYQLGAVEVTAPKEVDYNPSVLSISAKDIRDKNADNISQAIRMTPGLHIREIGTRAQRGEPGINIRGYGVTQVGLYLDGIPIMSIYDRQTDYSQYVMHGIDSVHITKGFVSPVYGMNIMGGAINLISAKPQKELEIGFSQKLLVGRHSSPDESRQSFDIGTNQGKFYVSAGISHTNRDQVPLSSSYKGTAAQPRGDKLNSYYKNVTAKLKAGIQPNENHEYSLNFIYQRGERGGLFSSSGGNWWEWPHYDKKTIYLLGTSYFTPNLSLNTRLYYDNFYNILNIYGKQTNGQKPSSVITKASNISVYDDDTYGAILSLNWDIAERTNLKFGTNLKYDRHFGTDGDGVTTDDLQELVSSEFIQFSQGLWNFRFVLAATYDRADTFKEYTDKSAKAADLGNGNFSLQGVVYYDFAEGNSLHLNVGKKENLPTLKARYSEIWGYYVPNPDLGVESAINYEIGYDLALENTALNVAVFYNDMTNMFVTKTLISSTDEAAAKAICSNPNQDDNNYECFQNINADSGYTYGIDIGVEQSFLPNNMLVLGAGYSFIQKKAEGDEIDAAGGKKITEYPNHIANAKIAIRPLRNLEIVALGSLESAAYYVDGTGYTKGKNYFTLDMSARYEIVRGLGITLGVMNLSDRDNYYGTSTQTGTHYAGRQWFAGVDYRY